MIFKRIILRRTLWISMWLCVMLMPSIGRAEIAPTKEIFLPRESTEGTEYKKISIDFTKFEIPAGSDDHGSKLEFEFSGFVKAYAYDKNKNKKNHLTYTAFSWWEEVPEFNLWSGIWWDYPLDRRLVIYNVPASGIIVEVTLELVERDDHDPISIIVGGLTFCEGGPYCDSCRYTKIDEYHDLNPGKRGHALIFDIYPSNDGFAIDNDYCNFSSKNLSALKPFGKSISVYGTGEEHPDLARAGITFTVKKEDQFEISDTCNFYTHLAVEYNQTAIAFNCSGFQPPVWSNDTQKHYNWCTHGGNFRLAPEQNDTRAEKLKTCLKNKPKHFGCDAYAKRSVAQNQSAKIYNCGFQPPVWSDGYQGHYNWCMHGGNYDLATTSVLNRDKEFSECRVMYWERLVKLFRMITPHLVPIEREWIKKEE